MYPDPNDRLADDGAEAQPIEVLSAEDGFGVGVGSDILVVDDNEGSLLAYRVALEPLGRNVIVAKSGIDAIAKLLDHDFALILLDVAMPGMTGLEMARLARQRPRNRRLPIIFITGQTSSTELVVEAYELGGSDFVVKPVMPEVLRAKVRVYLELQERTRALVEYARQLHEAHVRADESATLRHERAASAAVAHRLRKLQQVTAELARAKTPTDVAVIAVRLGSEAVGARAGGLWTVTEAGGLTLVGQHGYPDDYLAPFASIPSGAPIALMRAFETREPIWCEGADDYPRISPVTLEHARKHGYALAFAALPLIADGAALGVLVLAYPGNHPFPPEERDFLVALVRACEQALDRARLYVEERAARRAAEEDSRLKAELLMMLGHELRNPLGAISLAFEMIKLREGPLTREHAVIDRQLAHFTHLVNELIDVNRLTRGVIAMVREPVRVVRAIEDAAVLVKPWLDQRKHELRVSIPDDAVVDADRERLSQALMHLLSNAAKYTQAGGRIDVSAESMGAFVCITVRDNGGGIPQDLLPRLFEPFVQGPRTLDRQGGGLGVGLAIVRSIVELHGGSVEVRSEALGSTFTLKWPAHVDRSAPVVAP